MAADPYSDVSRDFLKLAGHELLRPDLRTLSNLTRSFGRLPYENITKIIRAHEFEDIERRIRTPDIVLGEHIDLGAGGTCFSLTFFFERVLRHAGFAVRPVFCDRSYGPDTHCALIVKIANENYLVDPGYLMEEPIFVPIQGESVQRSASCITKLARLGSTGQLLLVNERDGARKIRYRLKEAPVTPDLFRRKWIESFDWAMMRHICVSRQTGDGQLFMRDGNLRFSSRDKKSQESIGQNFGVAVSKTFGIDPQLVDVARDCLAADAARYRSKITVQGK